MIKLGDYNTLTLTRFTDHGAYMDGGEVGEILLPKAYVTRDMRPGTQVDGFVYLDQGERLVGTFETPLCRVGDFAMLRVAWGNEYGAFLHWGLMKDLFVPFSEQKMKMQQGKSYLVHVHIDPETRRIVASAKVERYLSKEHPDYQVGEEVEVLVWQRTDLGVKVIVENLYGGLLYNSELFTAVEPGMKLKAYVKQVREDGKIDLTLHKTGYAKVEDFSDTLLTYLKEHGGYVQLHDKSPAEAIYDAFGVSKKTFKKGVGDLYKKRLITISEAGIKLL